MFTHIFSLQRLSLFPCHFINNAFVIPCFLGTVLFISAALHRLVNNSKTVRSFNTLRETSYETHKHAVWKIDHPEY
jgi:hypothetical protein